jgi:hypothetical protein
VSSRRLFGLFEQGLESAMAAGIIGGVGLPAGPDDVDPGAGQDAYGVRMIVSAGAGAAVELGGPWVCPARPIGEVTDGVA